MFIVHSIFCRFLRAEAGTKQEATKKTRCKMKPATREHTGLSLVAYLTSQVFAVVVLVVVAMAAYGFRDINDALAFYGVYHREPMNQFIHFFGVPLIIWTLFILASFLPIPVVDRYFQIKIPFTPTHSVTYATIAALGYAAFYIKIDPFGGLLYSPVLYAMYASATTMAVNDLAEGELKREKEKSSNIGWTGTGKVMKTALLLHVLAWYIQIHPGHAVFEGAKPALMDSFGGALTSAPLFAFYEGLWFLGINLPLQEQTHALVAKYTAELCAAGATMRVCASV